MDKDLTAKNKYQITDLENDTRLDRWIQRTFPELNFIAIQKLLRTGQVRVNGKRARGDERLISGQEIRVPPVLLQKDQKPIKDSAKIDLPKAYQNYMNWIVYDDNHFLVINKPTGLAVQGGSKTKFHLDLMLDLFRFNYQHRPRLVHRLDKDTSGLLVLARHLQSAQILTKLFHEHQIKKTYWALVVGVPKIKQGQIKAPLMKTKIGDEEIMRVAPDGQPAVTDYQIVDQAGQKYSWLALWPKTGRTHQLRVHCQYLKTPICGDDKYGVKLVDKAQPYQQTLYLHAQSITIPYPGQKPISLTAALPIHMQQAWEDLGFDQHQI